MQFTLQPAFSNYVVCWNLPVRKNQPHQKSDSGLTKHCTLVNMAGFTNGGGGLEGIAADTNWWQAVLVYNPSTGLK